MKIAAACVLGLAVLCLGLSARGAEMKEKWVFYGGSIRDQASTDKLVEFLRQAKAAGCTHIQLNEGGMARLDEATAEYLDNAKRVLAAANELDIAVVPGIFAIGYSGRYLWRDFNLAEGIPVREAPFVVKDGVAAPDTTDAPLLANGGFDEADGDKLAGWSREDLVGKNTFVDRQVKHSGNSSLKITSLDKLPAEAKGSCRISQKIAVKPFRYYRVTLRVKTEGIAAEKEDYVLITSSEGKRRNCYTNLHLEQTQDWTEQSIAFSTFEATSIDFSVGASDAKAGTIWFDDITIEPAGLLNILRRDLVPLVVTNEDRSVTYDEGKDFEAVVDPRLKGYRADHDAPVITLTKESRIKEGQNLLVSFFFSTLIYDDQAVCSVEDPKILEIMEDQMKRIASAWPAPGYFMSYDEMRIGGWELQPNGEHLAPGQILAQHVAKAVGMVKKYAPDAKIYVWSDMFDPTHNARPFAKRGYYYLVNGNWDGGWEGLPSDVIIMNWNGTENVAESLRWFAGRGHRQIMAGYYDGDPKQNLDMWLKASDGVPNVIGMMYTTWRHDYEKMPAFFNMYDEGMAKRGADIGSTPGR